MSAHSRSAELYRRALETLPGGVSRNTVLHSPHPAYAAHASGCRVTDIEGVERIDFANNMASHREWFACPRDLERWWCRGQQRGLPGTSPLSAAVIR